MSVCIEKRGKSSWRVTLHCGYTNGRQNRIRKTYKLPIELSDEEQRKEIDKRIELLRSQMFIRSNEDATSSAPMHRQEPKSSGHMLFQDYVNLYLEEHALHKMQPKTLYQFKIKLDKEILPFFSDRKLSEIRSLDITRFRNHLSTLINERTGKQISAQTVCHYIAALSSMLNQALNWDLIDKNPCTGVARPKVEVEEKEMLKPEDRLTLMCHLEQQPLKYICISYLAMMGGMRVGEITALKWDDIDFNQCTIHVRRAKSYTPTAGQFDKEPKSKAGKRVISISQKVLDKLNQLKDEQEQHKSKLGDKWQENGYLFTDYYGASMGHNTPTRWFKDFLEKIRQNQREEQTRAGIPENSQRVFPYMTFHDLRHLHASLLIGSGVDIKTVSKRLGHAKTSITLDVYGHSLAESDVRAAAIIESHFLE